MNSDVASHAVQPRRLCETLLSLSIAKYHLLTQPSHHALVEAINLQEQILPHKGPPPFILVTNLLIIIGSVQNKCEKVIRGRPHRPPVL